MVFRVAPSGIDETGEGSPTPAGVAGLAESKARAVAARSTEPIVLGADTVVVVDGEALGKPADDEDAARMLRRLRGRAHTVITGLAVVESRTGRARTAAVRSRVLVRPVDDAALHAYVASGEPRDKAGAYAVQGRGGDLVAAVIGSYSNVIGLPLAATRRLLLAAGAVDGEA